MQPSQATLFVVDDDEAMLDAIATMGRTVGLNVETHASAQGFLSSYRPDRSGCLVLDVRMPHINGLDLQDTLKARGIELPVIIVTGHGDVQLAVRALKAGAMDFLEKPFREQDLLDRIYAAFERDAERRQRQAEKMLYVERFATLSVRERDVMQLLIIGNAGKEIAAKLNISYKTMEKFRARVMKKMCAGSVAELVMMAIKLRLISADDESSQTERGE